MFLLKNLLKLRTIHINYLKQAADYLLTKTELRTFLFTN